MIKVLPDAHFWLSYLTGTNTDCVEILKLTEDGSIRLYTSSAILTQLEQLSANHQYLSDKDIYKIFTALLNVREIGFVENRNLHEALNAAKTFNITLTDAVIATTAEREGFILMSTNPTLIKVPETRARTPREVLGLIKT